MDPNASYTSDIDLRKVEKTEPTLLGRRRTFETVNHFEKVFILVTVVNLTVSLGFTIFRISTLTPTSSDFTLALLLLLNIAFCYFYTFHGILYEQPYEILVLIITTISVLVYIVLSYSESSSSDAVKTVRLVFTAITNTLVAVCAIKLAIEYHSSGNLVFRLVGADSRMQSMCRKLQRAIVLIMFDAQALVSCLLLIVHGTEFFASRIIILSCGIFISILWSIIGFIGMHKEKPLLIWVFLICSPIQPAYVFWQITVTGLYETDLLIETSVYVSGTLLLLIHLYLFVNTVQVYRNFGKGLRERVYEVASSTPRVLSRYGSTDSSDTVSLHHQT